MAHPTSPAVARPLWLMRTGYEGVCLELGLSHEIKTFIRAMICVTALQRHQPHWS